MRTRRLGRLRGRLAGCCRRLAHFTDTFFSVLQRHTGGVVIFCLALFVSVIGLRFVHSSVGKVAYLGPILLRLANVPLRSLGAFLLLGTGLHALVAYTRRLLILRLVMVAALLFWAAELCCAFDKIYPAAPRVLCGVLVLPCIFLFLLLRGSLARVRRLVSVSVLIAYAGILPVLFGRAASDDTPGRATELAQIGVWAALWALGLAAWITNQVQVHHRHFARVPNSKKRVHLGVARTFALVLVLPPYLSLDLASSVRNGDATLEAAHRMIIRSEVFSLLEKRLSEAPAGVPFDGEAHQIIPGLGNLKALASCEDTCEFSVKLEKFTNTEAFDFTFNGRDLARGLLGARIVLARLAVENGVRLSSDASSRDLYFAIKDRVESRMITIPAIDLQLSVPLARWAVAVAVIALLILVRNRAGLVLSVGRSCDDEPWLLLDPMDWLERLVAAGYLLSIAGSASIVAGALMFTVETPAQAAAVLCFWTLGLALSLSVVHRLLLLRARRRTARRVGRRVALRSSHTLERPDGNHSQVDFTSALLSAPDHHDTDS